jgi:hypothetical protein
MPWNLEDLTPELRERAMEASPELREYFKELSAPWVEVETIAKKDEEIAKLKMQLIVDKIYHDAYNQALLDYDGRESIRRKQEKAEHDRNVRMLAIGLTFLVFFVLALSV